MQVINSVNAITRKEKGVRAAVYKLDRRNKSAPAIMVDALCSIRLLMSIDAEVAI